MSSSFESKPASVSLLLGVTTKEQLIVPEFQRGYEWSAKHVGVFWDDLDRFRQERGLDGGPERYFLGPIVVQQSKEKISLLDGQQRLATVTIALGIIRDKAKALGTKEAENFANDTHTQLMLKSSGDFALVLGNTDKDFFRDYIQAEEGCTLKPRLRTHRNIVSAKRILSQRIGLLVGENPASAIIVLKTLRDILRYDLIFASIPVASERDAFRIFETLNDRGLRLSVPDLLLNYLMREAPTDGDRSQIRVLWTDMVEQMGKRDINRFLRHLWLSKYGDLKSTDLFSAIKDRIETEKSSSLDFARACATDCGHYADLLSYSPDLGSGSEYVRTILQDLGKLVALPLLLSGVQVLDAESFARLCQWVIVFATRYSVIANLDPSGLESIFYSLAQQLRNLYPKDGSNGKPTSKGYLSHIKNALEKSAPSNAQLHAAADAELSEDGALYVVTRIAESIESPDRAWKRGEANLEHIFPKHPKEDEWGGPENHERLEPLLWNIGNLTLYGKKANGKLGNKEFPAKKKAFAECKIALTQGIANRYEEWTEATIKLRARWMLEQAIGIWSFENPSRV